MKKEKQRVTLLWPPSPHIDDTILINRKSVYIFSSFEMQPHGNINASSEDIIRLGNGISKILIHGQTKVYRKNAELSIANGEGLANAYDAISLIKETSKKYIAPDNGTYLFNRSGVSQMSMGMPTLLTVTSEVRHFSFGYLDRIITATSKILLWSSERLLRDILMHYRREEEFNWYDYESLDLSPIAFEYIESCEKIGKVNSAAKRFIMEGRI